MARYRNIVSALAGGNQTQSTIAEKPYDVVRAACYSPALGLAIKRLRAAGDPKAGDWNNVILTLHKVVYTGMKAAQPMAHRDRAQLCRIAVTEWYHWQCLTCNGAGISKNESGVVLEVCPGCNGSKLRRFHDSERATLYKRRLDRLAEDVLTTARNYLVDHENATDYNAASALDRAIPEEYVA